MVRSPRPIRVVGAAVLRAGRCLAAQRGPDMSLPGKWEFPGGKVERGERPAAALARELREELGVEARVGDWLGRGESLQGRQRVVLDVFAATLARAHLHLREHQQTRWLPAEDLYGLDWASADVPVLPAVRARMEAGSDAERCAGDPVVVSADWGKEARKRAVYTAVRQGTWRIARRAPPAAGWTLDGLLDLARRLRDEHRAAVLVGIDAVLGVPFAFARSAGAPGFLQLLPQLARSGGLEQEAGHPAAWRPQQPFFRIPSRKGGLSDFVSAAGGRSAVLRQMDLRTGAKPAFALSGIPGTVGSGSRALWRELAPHLEQPDRDFRVWPFEGALDALTSDRGLALAEIYPRAAYAIALAPELPAKLRRLPKTQRPAREQAMAELLGSAWIRGHGVDLGDVDRARGNEDDFDALMTAAALVRLLGEGQALSHEMVDPRAEGGILGTGGVRLLVGRG